MHRNNKENKKLETKPIIKKCRLLIINYIILTHIHISSYTTNNNIHSRKINLCADTHLLHNCSTSTYNMTVSISFILRQTFRSILEFGKSIFFSHRMKQVEMGWKMSRSQRVFISTDKGCVSSRNLS